MTSSIRVVGGLILTVMLLVVSGALAQDWPQWRGPNRDGKAMGFKEPKTWPKELTQKWKVTVGDGVSTPALVGDKIYVFARQGGNEIIRCLDATNGKELWQEKDAQAFSGKGDTGYQGPRSSPTVADGKVVTLGVNGILSCFDAANGKLLWRNNEFKGNFPTFHTACSPIVEDGLCIVQLGSERSGGVLAYEQASGKQKWKWTGDGTAYSSPILATVDGTKVIVAETANKVVGLSFAEGKLLWETPFVVSGRGYNAATPMVVGQTVLYAGSGRPTKAVKIEKKDDAIAGKELWSNADNSVIYNTPIIKNDLLFGLSNTNRLFCINTKDGKTVWASALGGGGGRSQGYGSIVDAGSVLFALTPGAELVVFEPSDKEFKPLARYKVADGGTYAYPIISGNRVFVKDSNSLTLWTIE